MNFIIVRLNAFVIITQVGNLLDHTASNERLETKGGSMEQDVRVETKGMK